MADAEDQIIPEENKEEMTNPLDELEEEEREEALKDAPADEEDESEEDSSEEDEEEVPQISRREQLRIQDLLKRDPKDDKKPKVPGRTDRIDYRKEFQVEDEDAKKLEDDRTAEAEYFFTQGLERAKMTEFRTRLEVDAPRVETRYPILDKRNEDAFHPAIANSMNQFYLSMVGFDPDNDTVQNEKLRYADFVDAVFELADEISHSTVQKQVDAIKEQAAKTGIRPDGSSAKKSFDLTKAPGDMSEDELKAAIAATMPRR